MNKPSVVTAIVVLLLVLSGVAWAADADAGKLHYEQTCIACHGPGGISVVPIYPNLRGQKSQYLITQIKAYRDGKRADPIMAPMARDLTDTEIVNLSALKPD